MNRRRYASRFMIDGVEKPVITVFEYSQSNWAAKTVYAADHTMSEFDIEIEKLRRGVRLYKRKM